MRFDLTKFPVSGGLLLGLAMGIFGALLALSFLPKQDYRRAYGEALAALTARYSSDEVFHQNLVAQQSLLSELVKYPQVGLATIHDAQQKLRVQAGNKHLVQMSNAHTFSAPILLHDRVAGYIHVTLVDPLNAIDNIQAGMMWLGALLLLLALWIIWRAGAFVAQPGGNNPEPATPSNSDLQAALPAAPALSQMAYVALEIKNIALLKQQLSVGVYQSTLARLNKINHQVLALYDGTQSPVVDGTTLLSFKASRSADQALYNAVCASHLIIALTKIINNIPLEITALVCCAPEQLNNRRNLPVCSVVLDIAGSEDLLRPYLSLVNHEHNDQQKVISAFVEPTQGLLDEQYQQLCTKV